ncbi:hypothetical protein FJTKL_04176 [Diaporthe vaccinii]|uniref:Uncharacterized protein n=1 Tax=Diaporthe vaccinii TaxID=105482 RepID=A0ABR4DTD7_9PEZI
MQEMHCHLALTPTWTSPFINPTTTVCHPNSSCRQRHKHSSTPTILLRSIITSSGLYLPSFFLVFISSP